MFIWQLRRQIQLLPVRLLDSEYHLWSDSMIIMAILDIQGTDMVMAMDIVEDTAIHTFIHRLLF